jgi:hypothetical protein
MPACTAQEILTVHSELLKAFFQFAVSTGAITDDAMNAIFAMTVEGLQECGATNNSGHMAYLNSIVGNVKQFADARDKLERKQHS